ncbi:MAG: MFS transporter, partial [Acidovorax sp.]|nr:MFS transporter [Acidovorax sp.]
MTSSTTAAAGEPPLPPTPAAPPAMPARPEPLKGAQLVLGTLALSLATFMNVLDSSIANVAIP